MKAVFIDRDGTMGGTHTVEYPTEYQPYPGTKSAFLKLKKNGFSPMVFSNQSCIARGKDNGYDFAAEFREIGADDWFICPHDDSDNCGCRKPDTGLLLQAQEKYGLNLKDCYVIGDRWSDMVAGGKMGCRLILVLTGRGKESLGEDRKKWGEYEPDFIAADLSQGVDWLCNQQNRF